MRGEFAFDKSGGCSRPGSRAGGRGLSLLIQDQDFDKTHGQVGRGFFNWPRLTLPIIV